MLTVVGTPLVLPDRPDSLLVALAIDARTTGRDIIERLKSEGRSALDAAITDFALIESASRKHDSFDLTGNPNLFIKDDVTMLSAVKAHNRRGSPLVIQSVNLLSRVPWRKARFFFFIRNPLAV